MEHTHLESKCLTMGYKTFYGPGYNLASQSYFPTFPKTHTVPQPRTTSLHVPPGCCGFERSAPSNDLTFPHSPSSDLLL